MGTFFELGKAKAGKGEEWAPLSSAVPKYSGNLTSTVPRAIGLWETFTFFFYFVISSILFVDAQFTVNILMVLDFAIAFFERALISL